MFVQTEVTPNPNSLKFLPGKIVSNNSSFEITKKDDVKKIFTEMLNINDKPVLIDCVVDPDDMVFPMVPAGGSNDQIIMNKEDLKQL